MLLLLLLLLLSCCCHNSEALASVKFIVGYSLALILQVLIISQSRGTVMKQVRNGGKRPEKKIQLGNYRL